jgi:hypothetical protein
MDLKGHSIGAKRYQLTPTRARTKTEKEAQHDRRRAAAVEVCARAKSPEEARSLLEMLGLLDFSLRAAQ